MLKFKFINQKEQIIQWFKEGKQYVNMAINADDIQKQEYSWIDLFDFKSSTIA